MKGFYKYGCREKLQLKTQ